MKLASGKATLPGRKQVFRDSEPDGTFAGDVIAGEDEALAGTALLRMVMRDGARVPGATPTLEDAREHAREQRQRLPDALRSHEVAATPYPVRVSQRLEATTQRLRQTLGASG